MRTTAITLFAIGLGWLVMGCGTILGRKELPPGVYPATRMDGALFWMGVGPDSIVGENHMPLEAVLRCCIVVATIPDVPISVLTDTILLPVDLMRHGKKKDEGIPIQSPSGVLLQPGDKLVIPMTESDRTQVPKK